MTYLLDTNICIHVIRHQTPAVLRRLSRLELGAVGVSIITAAELYYGTEKSAAPAKNRAALARFLSPLEVEAFDSLAAMVYGRVRSSLERKGTPIGPLDMLIAAHALRLEATLVTNNLREFERVAGLRLEDWTH